MLKRFLLLLLYCFMCPPTKLAFCPVLTPGSQGPPGWSVKCLGRRKNVPANCSSATQSVAKSLLSYDPQDHYLNLHWWRAPSLPPFPRCIFTLTRIFCKLYIIESTIMFIFLYFILFWTGINRLCLSVASVFYCRLSLRRHCVWTASWRRWFRKDTMWVIHHSNSGDTGTMVRILRPPSQLSFLLLSVARGLFLWTAMPQQ